jgi:Zn-dependent peptidase ImmA (M78 family)
MNKTTICQKAVQLLRKVGIRVGPVDVEAVASYLGISVRKKATEDEISGFIFMQSGGHAVVGINSLHHPNRQRFTLAHEIGHFVLHRDDLEDVHVDKFVLQFRDKTSSKGQNLKEIQANRFAAELLMPEEFLRRDVKEVGLQDLHDDEAVKDLAKKYQVSVQAMTTRLTSLGFE